MLDQRRATLHPIAVIIVCDAIEIARLGRMDMAANNAIDLAHSRLIGDRVFEAGDELDRILDLALGMLRQRPIGQVEEPADSVHRSEEHTSELQSLMRISYAVFCLKKKKNTK